MTGKTLKIGDIRSYPVCSKTLSIPGWVAYVDSPHKFASIYEDGAADGWVGFGAALRDAKRFGAIAIGRVQAIDDHQVTVRIIAALKR